MSDNHHTPDQPYPPIDVERPNPYYAQAMLDNAGGRVSEMSAVSLYVYNNIVTYKREDVTEAFHHISIVEMHHLDIFCRLAMQLGEDPRLWSNQGNHKVYWSPAFNRYPLKLEHLLMNSILSEKAAIEKYTKQTEWIKDINILEHLHRIIADERQHLETFEGLYAKYAGD